uniref:trypsin n=1 Tax=Sphaeramia orbicularis TaxID=375764 RepID=A0A672YWN5_9TELE
LSPFIVILSSVFFHTEAIYGGREAVPHSRPYMVMMVNGKTHHCGGFLLNEEFVMTAAHCDARHPNVLLGLHNFKKKENIQTISAVKLFPYKDYDPAEFRNDLMLIKLSSKATFSSNVRPITLADHNDPAPESCIVPGWGRHDQTRHMSVVLREVNLTLISSESCEEHNSYCSEGEKRPAEVSVFIEHNGQITYGVFVGDSGGPLVCENGKAYGVVSSYKTTTNGQKMSYFTKISDYREWIDCTMKYNSLQKNL